MQDTASQASPLTSQLIDWLEEYGDEIEQSEATVEHAARETVTAELGRF